MHLFELPSEIFSLVVDTAVSRHGLSLAMTMRLVCKTLEDEIVKSVFQTRAFGDDKNEQLCINSQTSTEYLLALILSDKNPAKSRFSHLVRPIREVVEFLLVQRPEMKDRKVEFIRRLSELSLQRHLRCDVIRHGIKCPLADRTGNPPSSTAECALAAATHLGLTSCVKELVLWGIRPVVTWFSHPYLVSIETQNNELQHLFWDELEAWRDANFPYDEAICVAGYVGDIGTLRWLLSLERDRNVTLYESAIEIAAEAGQSEAIDVLLGSAELANVTEKLIFRRIGFIYGDEHKVQTAIFFYAARSGQERIAREALEMGAYPLIQIHGHLFMFRRKSVIDFAASEGRTGIARLWIEKNAQYRENDRRCKGYKRQISNALMLAVRTGRQEMAQLLIDNGADVNDNLNRALSPPLVEAARRCQPEIIRLLLHYGADINLVFYHKRTKKTVAAAMKKYIEQNGMTSADLMLREALAAKASENKELQRHLPFDQLLEI